MLPGLLVCVPGDVCFCCDRLSFFSSKPRDWLRDGLCCDEWDVVTVRDDGPSDLRDEHQASVDGRHGLWNARRTTADGYKCSSVGRRWPARLHLANLQLTVHALTLSNSPRNLLELYFLLQLEILAIYWKFTKSPGNFWFSLRVCAYVVTISYNSRISEYISTKYFAVNQDQLILRLLISVSVN